jgi:hypothetical protein
MNRHSYEADAHRLSEEFPQNKNRKSDPMLGISSPLMQKLQKNPFLQENPIWLAIAVCIMAVTSLNSYWLFELRSPSSMQPLSAGQAEHSAHEINALALSLKNQLEDNEDSLFALLEAVEEMALQQANATRVRSAPGPQAPKMSPAEQTLKRWRYLGMSNSSSGISGLFHTGEGMQHIALNSTAVDGWHLSSVTRELAMLTSNDGKSVAISVSKE